MTALTAVILTRNEQDTIKTAIRSLDFCDEVLVIDDGSTDETIARAKQSGARVIERELNGDFSQQRNAAMDDAKHQWILFVDADEEIPTELANEITSTLSDQETTPAVMRIPRVDYWCGRALRHGELSTAAAQGFIRLVHRESGQWQATVHETFVPSESTPVTQLSHAMIHRPHQTVTSFLTSINQYSTLRAQELYQQNYPFSLFETVSYPVGKFFFTYVIKQGFRDGTPGWIYSFMMSFHSFLVRAKLFQYHLKAET